jgi:hypothetical protein
MRCFAVIELEGPQRTGRDKYRSATAHQHCDNYGSAVSWQRCCSTPRWSRGRLPGQSFEFRNQMLECVEILDGRH